MERSRPVLVVFDLGEVLATPPQLTSALSQRLGVPEEVFAPAYWRYRDAYDRGSTIGEYWRSVAGDLAVALTDDEVEELAAFDASAWTELRSDSLEVLQELREAGVRVAILSNAPRMFGAVIAGRDWSRFVERVFVSGELDVAKPDAEVYALVSDAMGVPPSDILFIDDREVNVDAARQGGWDAVQWLSPPQLRSVLAERGLLAASSGSE